MLTVAKVKRVKEPGRYGDGSGLYLNVAKGGSKSWVQRIVVDGRRRDIGLGGFPAVSLAKARERALENRTAVAEGRDPLTEKRKPKMPTFHDAARACYEANRPRWRSEKVAKNWRQRLERYAAPLFPMPVDAITRADVLAVLEPIWSKRPETARRVRSHVRTTLGWCQAHGFVESNVAGEAVSGALPAMPARRAHLRALPYQEVPAALETATASTAGLAAKACLEFLVLTAARSGEARRAMWAEIDLNARTWTIPAERMKGGVEHRVPLSDAAIAVLEQAAVLSDESGLLFPSPLGGRPLSDMTLTKVLRTTGLAERATVHGFRSSFRDWAAECTGASWAVMEKALAHHVGSAVERAYARSDLFEQRRALMQAWGAYVTGSGMEAEGVRIVAVETGGRTEAPSPAHHYCSSRH